MCDRRDLYQRFRLHQPALDAEPRRLIAREILGIDRVQRRVVDPVADEDGIERDVLQGSTRGFDHRLDRLQNMPGLRRRVARMHDVVALIARSGVLVAGGRVMALGMT